jgi:hypothetical protein
MKGLESAKSYWSYGKKEFVFVDVLPTYDKNVIWDFLNNPKYVDFFVHFPPYIPERVPGLYLEVKELCAKTNRKLI